MALLDLGGPGPLDRDRRAGWRPGRSAAPEARHLPSKFGWHAIGKVFELEKDHVFFVGEFSGTNFNDEGRGFLHDASVVCPGSNDIKAPGSAQGYCIVTDSDGDKAFLVWKCTSDRPGGKCDGDFQWTGGSGKYTGLRGNNGFYGVTILPTSSGYAVWKGEWELP